MHSINHLLPESLKGSVDLVWGPISGKYDRSVLTGPEGEKYDSFGSANRQQEYLAVRGIIRRLAKEKGLKSELFKLQKDASGKPAADYNGKRYHISIAHTHRKVLCAFSFDRPVGVDIERVDRPVNFDLKNRIMTSDEKELLKNESTLKIWTLKEALIKLHGKSLGVNLNECVITKLNEGLFEAEVNHHLKPNIYSLNFQNYWIAIAW